MDFQDALLTPDIYFDYLKEKGEFPPQEKRPKTVLFVNQKIALQYILHQHGHHWGKSFLSKLAFIDKTNMAICGGFGIGAPAMAIKLEELISWGVRQFVWLGTCSRLTSDFDLHTTVFAKTTFGIDGVTKYYSDANQGITVCREMESFFSAYSLKFGHHVKPVNAMSSDLFFGTSRRDVDVFLEGKADVLDMESAAFYAICRKRDAHCISILVTSDCLASPEWVPGFDSNATIAQLKKAAELAYSFAEECSV
jgi:purine-nucleoside phosphorylase